MRIPQSCVLMALLVGGASSVAAFAPLRVIRQRTTNLAVLQGMGGDYAVMRGTTTPSQKDGYIPPPTGPLKGIGGDYANTQGVSVEMRMPTGYYQQQELQQQPAAEPEDVAVVMEQVNMEPPPPLRGMGGDYANTQGISVEQRMPSNYQPPATTVAAQLTDATEEQALQTVSPPPPPPSSTPPLQGIGGDYGVMNQKISMNGQAQSFVAAPASDEGNNQPPSFAPLRGMGGDYANTQGISVEQRMPGVEYSYPAKAQLYRRSMHVDTTEE